MQPTSFRTLVLAAIAVVAVVQTAPATACDKGACGRAAAASVTRPGAHPNAVNRAKAKAKRAVPTAAVATAGAVAIIDPVTGQLAPATPAEIGALSQAARTGGVTPLAARPDVQVVRLADGTLVATVPPELMMHAYAKVGADGKVTFTCGDERVAAPAAPAAPAAAPWEAK